MKKYRNDDFEFTARDVRPSSTRRKSNGTTINVALVEDVKASGSWAELGSRRGRLNFGSGRAAGGQCGFIAASDGRDCLQEEECRGYEGAPRHSHVVSGNRTQLEKLITRQKEPS